MSRYSDKHNLSESVFRFNSTTVTEYNLKSEICLRRSLVARKFKLRSSFLQPYIMRNFIGGISFKQPPKLVTRCLPIAVHVTTFVGVTVHTSVGDNNNRRRANVPAAGIRLNRRAVVWRNLKILVSISSDVTTGSIGLDLQITNLLGISAPGYRQQSQNDEKRLHRKLLLRAC